MSIKRTILNSANRVLASRNYILSERSHTSRTMAEAIQAIAQRQHPLKTIIDIGASNGSWSAVALPHFPSCQYLLIEALPQHENALIRFTQTHANTQYVLAAAGETPGRIYFDAGDLFGGQASTVPFPTNNIEVPVTTIDQEVRLRQLPGPFLIKFDTHGFELPILKGAAETLANTEVIIMECYNFRIAPECLLFFEMCAYLEKIGFHCIDLADPMYRPRDGSFWQMDLIFAKSNRPELSYRGYR